MPGKPMKNLAGTEMLAPFALRRVFSFPSLGIPLKLYMNP
jgi:hypothetical protein